jgi:diguanylate cyclase (GGDEF)-like protein
VVLKEIHSIKNVTYIAEKLKTIFRKPMTIFNQDIVVQLSIGIAIYHPDHHATLKQLCKEADIALYQAKANGRNGYSVFGISENE